MEEVPAFFIGTMAMIVILLIFVMIIDKTFRIILFLTVTTLLCIWLLGTLIKAVI